MTTTVVYAGTADGYVGSSTVNGTYAAARAGASLAANVVLTCDVGQAGWDDTIDTGFDVYESFLGFDTSAIPDTDTVSAPVLNLTSSSDLSDTDFTLEARGYNWGGTLTTADYVPGASLAALTLLASRDTSAGFVANTAYDLTSEAAFAAAVNKTGTTYLLLCSSRTTVGTAPIGNELVSVKSADTTGTTSDPRLTVTHAAGGGGIVYGLPSTGGGVSSPSTRKGALRNATATASGVSAVTARTGRTLAAGATGGGVGTVAQRTSRSRSTTATAGGVVTPSVRAGRTLAALLSGGGVLTATETTSRRASVGATGGGRAVVTAVVTVGTGENHIANVAATGGGVTVLGRAAQHAATVAATGAGVVTPSIRSARLVATLLSGGGVLTASLTTGRRGSVVATGGGTATLNTGAESLGRAASVRVTGAGSASLSVHAGRQLAAALTGGGVATIDGATAIPLGLAARMRIAGASAGYGSITAAPPMAVLSVSDAPVITSARNIL